jgi:hypothetical protein
MPACRPKKRRRKKHATGFCDWRKLRRHSRRWPATGRRFRRERSALLPGEYRGLSDARFRSRKDLQRECGRRSDSEIRPIVQPDALSGSLSLGQRSLRPKMPECRNQVRERRAGDSRARRHRERDRRLQPPRSTPARLHAILSNRTNVTFFRVSPAPRGRFLRYLSHDLHKGAAG